MRWTSLSGRSSPTCTAAFKCSEERTMTALMTDLKKLGSLKAPDGFAERVLVEVGMADSYAPFETVLGTVYVAWNRLGGWAAPRAASAAEFEAWFQRDVGRPLLAAPAPAGLAAKIEDELSGKRR